MHGINPQRNTIVDHIEETHKFNGARSFGSYRLRHFLCIKQALCAGPARSDGYIWGFPLETFWLKLICDYIRTKAIRECLVLGMSNYP